MIGIAPEMRRGIPPRTVSLASSIADAGEPIAPPKLRILAAFDLYSQSHDHLQPRAVSHRLASIGTVSRVRVVPLARTLSLALPLLSGPAASAHAAELIRAIEFQGARSVETESLRARMRVLPGQPGSPEQIDQSIKELMASGLFSDVRIDRRGGTLLVTVTELPVIADVDIQGNAEIETKTIRETLQLKPGGRSSPARIAADQRRIRELYRQKGRLGTTIEPRTTPRPDGRIDIVLAIKEAPVDKIERIAFEGNTAFSERELRDVVSTSESGWLDVLKTAAFYDPDRIERDRDLVVRHYRNNGYPEARVTGVEAVKNGDGTAYTITFAVAEGAPARIRATRTESKVQGIDPATVATAVKVRDGAPYSREAIEKSADAMSETLSRNGQPFARVVPVDRYDPGGGTMEIVFRIEAMPPLYAERIEITGNTRTKDHVIRRELRIAEGDPINAYILERAKARLMRLGFFKSVQVKPMRTAKPDRAIVTFEVVEQETGEFSIGGGYSSSEGLVGDVGWTERNLFGNGQTLRLKLAGSATRFQADAGFTEPHFLGSNVAAGFDLFYKDVDFSKQASYMSRKVGGDIRIGVPLTDEWSTSANYTFTRSTLYNVGDTASLAIKQAVPGYPASNSTTYDTSSVGHGVTYDSRDSKKRPTTGVYYSLSQDFAGVGGDVKYLRNTGEARGYYTITDGVTAMGRVTGGYITGWGGQDVRLLDLFYKGGETVRGFSVAGFGPRDTSSANQDALGGRMFLATTGEVQFDLPGIPKDVGLRGAVFADAGSLWGVSKAASTVSGVTGTTPALRASAGIGLAWDSPLGPLRVDYAIPLVKQPFDKTQPLSFGLSTF